MWSLTPASSQTSEKKSGEVRIWRLNPVHFVLGVQCNFPKEIILIPEAWLLWPNTAQKENDLSNYKKICLIAIIQNLFNILYTTANICLIASFKKQ